MPGKVFAVVVVIITVVIAYCVIAHVWWMPMDISVHGPKIDHQIEETIFGAGILFIAGQLVLAAFAFLYGDSKGARKMKSFPGGAKPLIIFAFVVVGIEILVLSFVGSKAWGSVYFTPPDPDSVRVDVQAGQFAFYFRYPGPDGKFGPLHPELINEGTAELLWSRHGPRCGFEGRHRDRGAGDSGEQAGAAHPALQRYGALVRCAGAPHPARLRARDRDSRSTSLRLQTGRFEIVCTQLCGLGHYNMKAYLEVMSAGGLR